MTDYHTRANALYSYSLADYRRNDGKHALKRPHAIAFSSISVSLHREIVII